MTQNFLILILFLLFFDSNIFVGPVQRTDSIVLSFDTVSLVQFHFFQERKILVFK